jgi:N-glycosylase/DNA lyase
MSLIEIYSEHKDEIDRRLKAFRRVWTDGNDEDIFSEMAFCMFTPQTKAHAGAKAVKLLTPQLLFSGSKEEIGEILRSSGVRFHKNKSQYLVENRSRFYTNTKNIIKNYLNNKPISFARAKLAQDVKGWGYKEASHFLRNIGFGKEIAILDRHIMRTLVSESVIHEIPKNVSQSYLDIEEKMLNYCDFIGISPDAMDLVMWYHINGEFFK